MFLRLPLSDPILYVYLLQGGDTTVDDGTGSDSTGIHVLFVSMGIMSLLGGVAYKCKKKKAKRTAGDEQGGYVALSGDHSQNASTAQGGTETGAV